MFFGIKCTNILYYQSIVIVSALKIFDFNIKYLLKLLI